MIDIHEIAYFAEFFIICTGSSSRMLQALADSATEQVKKDYGLLGRVEGTPEYGWLLIDFGDVIVHLFSPDRRHYYDLEDLWSKGKILLHVQ
jgi:ribosome-associated protein